MNASKVHRLLNAVPAMCLPAGQSLQTLAILAHMVMDDAGATQTRVAGMGLWQRQANKAWQMRTRNCSTSRPACEAGRPLVWSRQVCGGSAVVPAALATGSDQAYGLPPTYRLCLSLSIPTPLICNKKTTKFSPFLFIFILFFLYNCLSLTLLLSLSG